MKVIEEGEVFMSAIPQFSSNPNEEIVQKLSQVLVEQREHLTLLCTITEYLKGFIQIGLDNKDVLKYTQKIQMMTDKQMNRYHKIDDLINTNIFQMKKGKTTDNTALIYGKEVRKIESGIRTLRMFVCDVINMMDGNQHLDNRIEERIRYFEKRSASLESEMNDLSTQLGHI